MRWRGGVLTRYFAYLYFAGIRPDELKRLSSRENELVNLKTRTITIPANISKTRHERHVTISSNLAAWLASSPGPIVPPNFDRLTKLARKHFKLSHDEARHSFISYHVALHRSIGDAALQAGNSEAIVKRHYLNTHAQDEGRNFFRIVPDLKKRKAALAEVETNLTPHLKAV
jgi:integrase